MTPTARPFSLKAGVLWAKWGRPRWENEGGARPEGRGPHCSPVLTRVRQNDVHFQGPPWVLQPLFHHFHLHPLSWTTRQMGRTNHTAQILCHLSARGFHLVLVFLYSPLVHSSPALAAAVCSVVSDSLKPGGLWPARLLCPWDSPGKNTGVGSHALLQGIFPTQESNPRLLCFLHCWRILYH